MAEIIYITCPLCGLNRVLDKKGSGAIARGLTITTVKGRIRFDHIELSDASIVQVRESQEGPEPKKRMRRGGGTGFVFKKGLTLEEMRDSGEYDDLVEQILSQIESIQARLKNKGRK